MCSATKNDSKPRFSHSREIAPGLPDSAVRNTNAPIFMLRSYREATESQPRNWRLLGAAIARGAMQLRPRRNQAVGLVRFQCTRTHRIENFHNRVVAGSFA